jgi:two-component system, OmpR family, response regulator
LGVFVAAPSILLFNEDEQYLADLSRIFQRASYQITECNDSIEVIQYLKKMNFDLVILDVHPSCEEDSNLLTEVRRISDSVPILIITGEPCLDSAVMALRHHVNDYLVKSVQSADLLKRVQTILDEAQSEANRKMILSQIQGLLDQIRSHPNGVNSNVNIPPAHQIFQQGFFTVNLTTREVFFENKQITLSPTELNYLVVLLRHKPEVVSHKTLVMEAQGFELSGYEAENLARWHIHALRKILKASIGKDAIQTVRGEGYCLSL